MEVQEGGQRQRHGEAGGERRQRAAERRPGERQDGGERHEVGQLRHDRQPEEEPGREVAQRRRPAVGRKGEEPAGEEQGREHVGREVPGVLRQERGGPGERDRDRRRPGRRRAPGEPEEHGQQRRELEQVEDQRPGRPERRDERQREERQDDRVLGDQAAEAVERDLRLVLGEPAGELVAEVEVAVEPERAGGQEVVGAVAAQVVPAVEAGGADGEVDQQRQPEREGGRPAPRQAPGNRDRHGTVTIAGAGEVQAVAPSFGEGRKVRTPTGSMLANGQARRRDGKCNRE